MKRVYLGIQKSQLVRIPDCTGESLEEELRRVRTSGEKIEAVAPMIYTDKADGVRPEFNPRTDKQEVALDAIEKARKSEIMKAQEKQEIQNDNTEMEV